MKFLITGNGSKTVVSRHYTCLDNKLHKLDNFYLAYLFILDCIYVQAKGINEIRHNIKPCDFFLIQTIEVLTYTHSID